MQLGDARRERPTHRQAGAHDDAAARPQLDESGLDLGIPVPPRRGVAVLPRRAVPGQQGESDRVPGVREGLRQGPHALGGSGEAVAHEDPDVVAVVGEGLSTGDVLS
jgi:hypothetical protein